MPQGSQSFHLPNSHSPRAPSRRLPTRQETTAFECALQCISELITAYGEKLDSPTLNPLQRAALELAQVRLLTERCNLHVQDHIEIERICFEYSARLREMNARK